MPVSHGLQAIRRLFDHLTRALPRGPVMSYFDTTKETFITVDSCPVYISAILSQQGSDADTPQVVAYTSRALTPVEQRYSQTEKEALGIVWGIEHLHLYIYGSHFILITDHKPLEVIYGNVNSKPSARIERWVLRLQPYSFSVLYKPGKDNPADFLSRHPTSESISKLAVMADEYVSLLALSAVPKAMTVIFRKPLMQTKQCKVYVQQFVIINGTAILSKPSEL